MSTRTTEEMAARIVDRVLYRLDTLGHKFGYNKENRRVLVLPTHGRDVLRALVREELERP